MQSNAQIYLITNRANGKRYVGQTKIGAKKRFRDHRRDAKRGSTTYFHRALRKYGSQNFVVEILEHTTADLLEEREIYFIAALKPEYNLTKGGRGGAGKKGIGLGTRWITDGQTQRRIPKDTEIPEGFYPGIPSHTKNSIKESLTGRTFSEAHRANITKSQIGRVVSCDTREKISKSQVGKVESEETRLNKSRAALAMWAKRRADTSSAAV